MEMQGGSSGGEPGNAASPAEVVSLPPAATLPTYAAALFLSAFLLFGVQPMFTKMVLPILGGTPAVWSVAMVFFQTALLAGYAYAHLLIRHLGIRSALIVHLVLMAACVPLLPIGVSTIAGSAPPETGQALWLILVFATSVGLPFFALAGNGPLLQAWFARSGHKQAGDPYFLYGASNIGSFAALLAYPFLVEPMLPLSLQSRAWFGGFVLLAVFILLCGLIMLRSGAGRAAFARSAVDAPPLVWRQRLIWIGLSAVPSGLLVAVTAHISTDVASAPLIWVFPLALFLLTFILTFRERPVMRDEWLARAHVWGAALVFYSLAIATSQLWWMLAVHLGTFFFAAMVCHTALYRSRPDPAHLTAFYLYISLGGMIGGLLCGLVAPLVLPTVAEYPAGIVLSLLALLLLRNERWREGLHEHRMPILIALAVIVCVFAALVIGLVPSRQFAVMTGAMAAGIMILWRATKPMLVLAGVTAALVMFIPNFSGGRESIRSFYGVHKLARIEQGRYLALMHGTTIHGAMRITNDDGTPFTERPEPTTYYAFDGAMGDAITKVRAARGGTLSRVAAVGLGTGSLACHSRPGEAWTYYEIDPDVVRIARDPRYFRFLDVCAPDLPIVLGDARLRLAEHPGKLDIMVVDAFSSDAIPTHLMTREAIQLYGSKLAPGGAIVFHISNRHMDLSNVLAATAQAEGFQTFLRIDVDDPASSARLKYPSQVAIIMRSPDDVPALTTSSEWDRVEAPASYRPWTDDYANILRAIADNYLGD